MTEEVIADLDPFEPWACQARTTRGGRNVYCQRQKRHPGPHEDGDIRWPFVHLQVTASDVACGAAMWSPTHEIGWHLGSATVDPAQVTCPDCRREGLPMTRVEDVNAARIAALEAEGMSHSDAAAVAMAEDGEENDR